LRELKRVRLGNVLFGMRLERLPHSVVFRALVSHVADTVGVLNRFKNTDKMCFFMDLDDRAESPSLMECLQMLSDDGFSYIMFETSKKHRNIICPDLISKDELDYHMKKYLRYMDYRFNYVYFRDGCNAIRITPKLVDGKMLRQIRIIETHVKTWPQTKMHRGLVELVSDVFGKEHMLTFFNSGRLDDSTKDDLIERRYETINW
jgi:hypothetical protein